MQNAKCKMQNAKCKIKTNSFRQPILGSGPKMDAGANEAVTRTEARKYCP
jgi:hypothetical protein